MLLPLEPRGNGYFSARSRRAREGDDYLFVLDGEKERPDPVSRFQPYGVHGPSRIVRPDAFGWKDKRWKGMAYEDLIFYELHPGTFTPEGTFEGAAKKIPYLKKLGITCVEIMPVAQFPGKRNWGYDGVQLYAPQNSYGGPAGMKKLIDACHRQGLSVCLDVVYNHLGPEGNYLWDYGHYFTSKHHTPWGDAVNYDDRDSRHVRDFIIRNACSWISEYHIDVLRLDAIHSIIDTSRPHILEELNTRVQTLARRLRRKVHIVAESDLNDARIIRPRSKKGFGLAGQWSDDFHHAVHALLTGETNGYYADYGSAHDIVKVLQDNFIYDGSRYSRFRKDRHGKPAQDVPARQFVVCTQNHDQVGNRAYGERLGALVDPVRERLAAFLLLLSPYTPLLFMGQEYGEKAPFQYFVDHGDPGLREAVRQGRAREFAAFGWKDIPDPASAKTFLNSRLKWPSLKKPFHQKMLRLYQDLIALRKKMQLSGCRWQNLHYDAGTRCLSAVCRGRSGQRLEIILSFSPKPVRLQALKQNVRPLLATWDPKYGGQGPRLLDSNTPLPAFGAFIVAR